MKRMILRPRFAGLVALTMALAACGTEDGKDGPPGQSGPEGPRGSDGSDGQDGDNGLNGPDGADGSDGADGFDGLDGEDGADGSDGQNGDNGAPGYARATIYVSNNGPTNAGTVDRVSESYGLTRSIAPGNNEGVAFSYSGALVQAGDTAAGASIRTVCAAEGIDDGAGFSDVMDRSIGGAATTLVNPKGIAIAHEAGYLFVANFNAMSIKVFGTAASGNVAPHATTTLAAQPWDLAYDENNDRLFIAQTNGTVAVIDGYVAGGFSSTIDRTITPASGGAQASINLHGIVYEPASDRLVLSDVGLAADATDGALFVIDDATTAAGLVEVSRLVEGPATLLGNPVDIALSGSDLRVAEKANDGLLVFSDIFDGPNGDVEPDLAVTRSKPESLAIYSESGDALPDVTDIADPSVVIPSVVVASNPAAGAPSTGQIAHLSSALNATQRTFNAALSLENVMFDRDGDVFATFDDGANTNGGIFIGNRVAKGRSGGAATPSRDRSITGAATGLVSPKGLDVVSSRGLVIVAENNATTPGVLVFSSCASGNVAPVASVAVGGRPWDVDFDEDTGRLFVRSRMATWRCSISSWSISAPAGRTA
jgi:hypothetical protein